MNPCSGRRTRRARKKLSGGFPACTAATGARRLARRTAIIARAIAWLCSRIWPDDADPAARLCVKLESHICSGHLADRVGRAAAADQRDQYPAAASVSASRRGRRSNSSSAFWFTMTMCGRFIPLTASLHDGLRRPNGAGTRASPPGDPHIRASLPRSRTTAAGAPGRPSQLLGARRVAGQADQRGRHLRRAVRRDQDAGLAVLRPPPAHRRRGLRSPAGRPTSPRAPTSAAPRPRSSGTRHRPACMMSRASARNPSMRTAPPDRPTARATAAASGPSPTTRPCTDGSTACAAATCSTNAAARFSGRSAATSTAKKAPRDDAELGPNRLAVAHRRIVGDAAWDHADRVAAGSRRAPGAPSDSRPRRRPRSHAASSARAGAAGAGGAVGSRAGPRRGAP